MNCLDRYQEVLTQPMTVDDGFGSPPDGPGSGADLDVSVVTKHPPGAFTPVESGPSQDF